MISQSEPVQCRRTSWLSGAATSVMPAPTSRPVATTVEVPTLAALVMSTELTPTPTPTPTLALAVVSPLPCAEASVLAELASVTTS